MMMNLTTARVLRLVLAAAFLGAGIMEHEPIAWLAGIILGAQALFNVSCSGQACTRGMNHNGSKDVQEATYDEVH